VIGVALTGNLMDAIAAKSREDAVTAIFAALDQTVVLNVITSVMVVVGASLLVLVMARIERRARARDREIRAVAAATVPVPAVEPAVEAPLPGA
jgi:ABC-type dipeptide/oligopeptide/nickel transport system permease component